MPASERRSAGMGTGSTTAQAPPGSGLFLCCSCLIVRMPSPASPRAAVHLLHDVRERTPGPGDRDQVRRPVCPVPQCNRGSCHVLAEGGPCHGSQLRPFLAALASSGSSGLTCDAAHRGIRQATAVSASVGADPAARVTSLRGASVRWRTPILHSCSGQESPLSPRVASNRLDSSDPSASAGDRCPASWQPMPPCPGATSPGCSGSCSTTPDGFRCRGPCPGRA